MDPRSAISSLVMNVCLLSIFLLLFSEIFYVKTDFGLVSLFLFCLSPLALIFFLSIGKICLSRLALLAYLFALVLSCYTFFGILLHNRPTLGIQFLSIFLATIFFVNIGYFANKKSMAKMFLIIIVISVWFAISQFIFNVIQYAGPFSIFEKFSIYIAQSQTDHHVEVIYGRSSGIFTSPNILGLFAGLGFWLIIFLKDEFSSFQYKLGLTGSLACLFLSISRGSILGLFFSGFLFLMLSIGKISVKNFIYGLFFVVILCGAFYVAYNFLSEDQKERFLELFSVFSWDFGKSENAIGRIDAWAGIAVQMQGMPWGTLLPPQIIINYSPDNQFIYYFAQGGVLLLLAVIIFWIALILLGVKKNNKDSRVFLSIILFSVINSATIVAMNSFVFMLFWLFLGVYSRNIQLKKL